jgi:homoserine O-acetyltransferase
MNTHSRFVSAAAILLAFWSSAGWADGNHQLFKLGDFTFESGATVPNTVISYVTHGKLNDDRSNAVLLPSAYSGDHHVLEFLIGEGKALDPDDYFIVATDMFANGLSSSPSNTPPPFDGPRFPQLTIRDNVRAAKRLLSEEFEVDHVIAVIGFSMGGQQALQWAVSYPNSVDYVVSMCGNARETPFGIVRLEGAKSALMADGSWSGGEYDEPPEQGLRALARHWAAWGVSQEWWRTETYKSQGTDTIEEALVVREAYFLSRDANNLIWQANAWQKHNVAAGPQFEGDLKSALGSIEAQVLLMPSETDLYFPVADAEYEHELIPNSELVVIPTYWGHSIPQDADSVAFVNTEIRRFLQQ